MSNLLSRLLTAGVAVPFLILAINWQNPIAVQLLIVGACAIGMHEWMAMTLKTGPASDRWLGVLLGTGLVATLVFFGGHPLLPSAATAAATVAVFLYYLFRHGDLDAVGPRIAYTIVGFYYVGLLGFLGLSKLEPGGAFWVYIALCIAWISDTGAYFAGRFLGPYWPRKLYESVSPKKTLIGFFGGIVASYLSVAFIKVVFFPSLTWADTVLLAVPANLLGQMGDLCESLIKRTVGVKDSGALLPGHGGMLDRIDAVLFVSPYVYVYAHWIHASG